MKYLLSFCIGICCIATVFGQKNLDQTLKQLNSESVPYVYVNELQSTEDILVLDTRQKEEYDVSHIKDAIWVGHKAFEKDWILDRIPNKNTEIIVYCSIGVRSEDIGETLQKEGYTHVKNLYGGIFEWKNQGNKVYKNNTTETDSVHTFNKNWGQLLTKGIKVYDVSKPTNK